MSTGKHSSTLVPVAKIDPMRAYFCAEVVKQEQANNLGSGHLAYCPGRAGASYMQMNFRVSAGDFCGLPNVACVRFFYEPLC